MADTYSVRMPDGTMIQGIPRRVDPQSVIKKYESDKASPEEGLQTFREGVGRGMVNIGRNIGNLAGMVSDESLEESERLDKPLMDTTSGTLGSIAGELALTAPVAGGVGGAVAKRGLGRALAARPMALGLPAAAGAGAGEGYLVSAPSTRESSMALGAAGGSAGHALSRAIARYGKGIAAKTKDVSDYMEASGEDYVPAARATEEGSLVNRVYESILPALPGGKSIVNETNEAIGRSRKNIFESSLPEGTVGNFTDDVQANVGELKRAMDDGWDNLAGVTDDLPEGPMLDVSDMSDLQSLLGRSGGDFAKKLKSQIDETGNLSARQAFNLRANALGRISSSGSMGVEDIRLAREGVESAMDEVLDKLPAGARDKYDDMITKYSRYKDLETAALGSAARGGEFDLGSLAGTSARSSPRAVGAAGEGVVQQEAQLASKALGKKLEVPSFWRWLATAGLFSGGFAGGGPLGAGLAVGGAAALRKGLGAKKFQQALMGDLASQKWVAQKISENPEAAAQLQQVISAAGASTAQKGAE